MDSLEILKKKVSCLSTDRSRRTFKAVGVKKFAKSKLGNKSRFDRLIIQTTILRNVSFRIHAFEFVGTRWMKISRELQNSRNSQNSRVFLFDISSIVPEGG